MNSPLSEADLRLTAKAVGKYLAAQEHSARFHGQPLRPGRVAQLKRLERFYLELSESIC